ncbi:MAG: hypothetical protein AAGH57_05760 [Pseudomonadota bacterium]
MAADLNQRHILASLSALALMACSDPSSSSDTANAPTDPATNASGELSPESLEMAQTAWLSVSDDGAVYTTFLDPDGRYRDMQGGALAYTGAWEQGAARELCFTPDKGAGSCWSHGAPGLDGVMRATSSAGRAIALKRIAYVPPPAPKESADGAPTDPAQTDEGAD